MSAYSSSEEAWISYHLWMFQLRVTGKWLKVATICCHVSAGKKFKAATMLVMFQLRVAGKYFRAAFMCVIFQLRVVMNKLSVATIFVLF